MKTTRLYLLVICTALLSIVPFNAPAVKRAVARLSAQRSKATPKVPAIVRSLRPNYPYSVVPGGVYSAGELRWAVAHDPLVRDHYKGFDTRVARLVATAYDRFEYASYRMNGRIFWSKHKLRIPKGEILVSDGANLARTRCGNRLSETPMAGQAQPEQDPKDLSLGSFDLALLRDGPLTFAMPPPSELGQLPEKAFLSKPEAASLSGEWPEAFRALPVFMAVPGMPGPTQSATVQSGTGSPGTVPAGTTSASTPVTPGPPAIAEVPEPGALTLFAMLLVGSGLLLRRLRRPEAIPAAAREKRASRC